MSNDHNVDMSLFLSHFGFDLVVVFRTPVFWLFSDEKVQVFLFVMRTFKIYLVTNTQHDD